MPIQTTAAFDQLSFRDAFDIPQLAAIQFSAKFVLDNQWGKGFGFWIIEIKRDANVEASRFAGAQRKIGVAIEVIVAGFEADRPVQSVEPIGIQQNEFRSIGLGQNITLFASFDMRAHARFWQKARKIFFRESKVHQAWR